MQARRFTKPQPIAEVMRARGMSPEEFALGRAHIIAEIARRSGSRSFAAFVKQAWQYAPSVDPLGWSWHMDVLCSHLEESARGRMRRLLINIPPGHAKSVLVSVLWPAWIWTWWPKCQFMFGSYSAEVATRDSLRCRAVIESDWYKENYSGPGKWRLRHDQNAKHWFINTAGGERFATGVGGTGRRAHVIGIDDPLDTEDRHSRAARDRANDWIGTTLSQRFPDARTGIVVMIMQRLDEKDPSAFVLAGGGWQHLMMPSEYDPERASITHHMVNGELREFWRDPREERGALLFRLRFPEEVLEDYKRVNQLGPSGFATLHQQNPQPEGGNLFKLEDWRFWKPDEQWREKLGYLDTSVRPRGCIDSDDSPAKPLDMDALEELELSVDGAGGSETDDGSFTVIQAWGRIGARRPLLYQVRRRMDFVDSVAELQRVIKLFPRARRKLIEAKASGKPIINSLERHHGITGIEPINPTSNKEDRARIGQPYQRAHNVELPEGAPFNDEYVTEHAVFPKGANDDQVDCTSQALAGFEVEVTTADLWKRAGRT